MLALANASGGLWWLWADVSTSPHQRLTGSGGSVASTIVFVGLVLLTPAVLGVYAWRSRPPWREVGVVAVIGTFAGLAAVVWANLYWWGAHGCMT